MYKLLDIFFLFSHSFLIIFNLFGWIWYKTRKVNLLLLLLTGFSWVFLGIWYGFGYCPLTDWHWETLNHLGYYDLPNSYVKYLLEKIFSCNFNSNLVDTLVVICFFIALIISIYMNIKNSRLFLSNKMQ